LATEELEIDGAVACRSCFRWEAGNAYDVEIVDYH
jgi:hypothetical protein